MISADDVVHIANSVGISVARRLVDVHSGALVESTSKTYRPTAAIARFVRERDEHCRFPGCAQPAKYCDADHVVPWPAGPTSPANLQSLCRHHHRAKHETDWQVTMTADGVCTWTSPGLRTYVTKPADKTTVISASVPLTTEMTTAVG